MAIDPATTTTVKVGELASAGFNASDLTPHEVGGILKKGTLGDLATFIGGQISATSGVGFRAVSVTSGQTLPTTTQQEFILVGPGTYINVGGGATITTTEELNALVSNGTYWFIGVEIPIQAVDGAFEPAIATGTTSQYWRGDKTWQALNKTAVGLSNVDNTTDAGKPISDATQTALDLKANTSQLHNAVTIGAANGLSLSNQVLSLGMASSSANGALSSTDWTTFNSKEPAITAPGTVGSYWRGNKTWATLDTSVIPENGALFFTDARAKTAVTGNSGTTNYLSKFTSSGTIGNSLIYDNGTNVGIGTTSFGITTSNTVLGFVNGSNIQARTTVPQLVFSSNIDGDWFSAKYKVNGYASQLAFDGYGGTMVFNIAPSGIAGNSISWIEAMKITSSGNVGIGTTAPSAKLDIVSTEVVTTKEKGSFTISIANAATTEVIALETNATYLGHVTYASDPTRFKSIVVAVGQLSGSIQGSIAILNDIAGAQFSITCIGQSLRITNSVGSTQTFKIALTKIGVN